MKKIRLYVVDSCLLSRIAIKNILKENSNFEILGDFNSVLDCIKQMKKTPADIVICELELSDINGIEAIKLIKNNSPKTKIIVLSSIEDENMVLPCLANGACGYVIKKEELELKNIINVVIHGGVWIDSSVVNKVFSLLLPEGAYSSSEIKEFLTTRELEVLKLVCEGKTNSEIANAIIVSKNTAKAHVGSILNKLCVKDRLQAAVIAVKAHLF